jgi:hypothetical protein
LLLTVESQSGFDDCPEWYPAGLFRYPEVFQKLRGGDSPKMAPGRLQSGLIANEGVCRMRKAQEQSLDIF